MKINALRLFNVRRFAGRGVAIEGIRDGVNVLCAANEFGKSTSFEALHALFFQPHTGTPNEVRNLRPYSGGNPLIEVDVSTADGAFRITKQFYGGRSARVLDRSNQRMLAQADEAERFIADLVRGGTAGPAGLLWVRQGVTSLAEKGSERQVRASLLESVQGEVEAVTGGRRMAEIKAAAERELATLLTPSGRPKAGSRYAGDLAERDRLSGLDEQLAAQVGALRQALDERGKLEKRLAEIDGPDQRKERQDALDKAKAGFDIAKAQADAFSIAEAELRLAVERHQMAERNLAAFNEAVAKAKTLRLSVGQAELDRDASLAQRRDAVDAEAKASALADAAEADESAARILLTRLEKAMLARERLERRADLEKRAYDAEAAAVAIATAEAELARVQLPAKAVEELHELDIQIAALRAAREASRPSVTVVYLPGARPVLMEGVPLPDNEERAYDAQARLSVPGVGEIGLRANQPAVRNEALDRAETKRHGLLAAMGVATLEAARQRQARGNAVGGDLRDLKVTLSLLAPNGLPTLRQEVAAAGNVDPDLIELKEDPAAVSAALAEAGQRREQARRAARDAVPLHTQATDAIVAREKALAGLRAERAQCEAVLGPEDAREERAHDLAQRFDETSKAHSSATSRLEALRAVSLDLDFARAKLARAQSVLDGNAQETNSLREALAGFNAEIRTRSDEAVEERWRETADALAAVQVSVRGFEREASVLQRLVAALEVARSDAREAYLMPVMRELKPLLELLFDDVTITFDENTLLPQKIRRRGQDEDVERLSGGMREQLSVLTRLAFAKLLARDGRPAPVILDDALVYSDDDRIETMFDVLHRQSRDQQIIIFSCRQRAFQKLGGTILRVSDWCP